MTIPASISILLLLLFESKSLSSGLKVGSASGYVHRKLVPFHEASPPCRVVKALLRVVCFLSGQLTDMRPANLAAAACCLFAAAAEPAVTHVRYVIIGAGPGGLQIAHYLDSARRDYVVLERNGGPGSFFESFPRFRQLISINKRYSGRDELDHSLRKPNKSAALCL